MFEIPLGTLFLLLIPFAIFAGFVFLVFVITLREKRMMWYFEPLVAPAPQVSDQAGYARQQSSDNLNPYRPTNLGSETPLPLSPTALMHGQGLTMLGYSYLGAYRHSKGGIYRIRYEMLLSQDRKVLAIIGCGSLMSIPVDNLSMVSFENRMQTLFKHESISNEATFVANYAGTKQTMLFNQVPAVEMDRLHRSRFAMFQPTEFTENPVNDYYRYRVEEQRRAIEIGYLRLVDKDVTLPTIKGAIYAVCSLYSFQIGRRFFPHQWRLGRRLSAQQKKTGN